MNKNVKLQRITLVVLAMLAAIAVSVVLVGCDEKSEPEQHIGTVVKFDGGEAGTYVLDMLYGQEKRLVFECDENKIYTFNITYIEGEETQDGGSCVINGDELGEHKVVGSYNTVLGYPRLIIEIIPKRLDAEISFDPMDAISVTEKDGETEYTYKYDGQPHHPYMQVKYNGQIVAKDGNERGFFDYAKVINSMNYTANDWTTSPVSEIGTYKVFYDVSWYSYIDPYNGDNFNKIDKTYVIVKIIP